MGLIIYCLNSNFIIKAMDIYLNNCTLDLIIYYMNPKCIPKSMDRYLNSFYLQQKLSNHDHTNFTFFSSKKMEKPLPIALWCVSS